MLILADVHELDSLRTTFRIADADHERVMSELVEEDRGLTIGGVGYTSPDKQLQLQTYAEALTSCLERQASSGTPMNDVAIRRLRDEYEVTADEHTAMLDLLVRDREGIGTHVLDTSAAIEETAEAIRNIERCPSPVTRFLCSFLEASLDSERGRLAARAERQRRAESYPSRRFALT